MTTEELSIANTEPAASPEPETTQVKGAEVETGTEEQAEEAKEQKPEKTPEEKERERERNRLQRGIDRRTRQLAEARAEAALLREQLTRGVKNPNNQDTTDDSEPLTLTKAELAEFVKAEAAKLAPTIQSEQAEVQRRQGVITSLEKTWGKERFDEVSSDLDEAFGGLTDRSGRPKPAIEAVFEAEEPAKVIEYLADPDNADEAEAIARMSAVQAGRAIAKLESKLSTAKPKPKTEVSKAPAPLETVRGSGGVATAPSPTDTKAWIKWRNEQERKGF